MAPITSTVWDMDPHTNAKHQILEEYLKAWFPILSRWSSRIIFLDGFAGPGVYSHGEEGSPVIAIKTAIQHKFREKFHEILFWFIEKDNRRAQKLKEVLQTQFPTPPINLKYEVEGAEFAPTLGSVLNELEKRGAKLDPTFAFLDPFGFSGLPMQLIAQMLAYEKCEVLITFMAGFVNRFTDELRAATLDELFATRAWRKIHEIQNSEERQNFLIDLYVKQLKEMGGAKYVRTFAIIGDNNQLMYYLVYATKNWKGLEVMKDAMHTVDSRGTYRFSDRTDVSQTFLSDYTDGDELIRQAAEVVFQRFKGKTASVLQIQIFVITETPYRFVKAILKHVEQAGRIVNVTGRSRALTYPDDDCLVTFSQ